jgi:hypothetical protein
VIERVVTGGQTGADQGGLRAARAAGIATGGWAPQGWLTESEDGRRNVPDPSLADGSRGLGGSARGWSDS